MMMAALRPLRELIKSQLLLKASLNYEISALIRYFVDMINRLLCVGCFLMMVSCYEAQRDCEAFKEGTFEFTAELDGEMITTTFVRQGDIEIDYFQGKSDTSEVRWINNCEYIVRKLNPKSRSEEKSIHMKILSTTADTYSFEYGIVGSSNKSKGTAIKIK